MSLDFSVDQSQIQGTRRIAALGTEVTYHFSEMTGPYRQLHNDALGVLNEKQKHGFSTVDKLVFLHQTLLFEDIPLTETLRVAQVTEQINMREGDVLFDNGEEGNAAYFIMVGELMLHVDGITIPMNNRRKPLGEVGLLYPRPRAGKVVATCNTVVLGLIRDDLEILFERRLVSQAKVTSALAVLTVNSLRFNYGQLEAKQNSGDTGSSLALEVARAGWSFDTTEFLYVGKTSNAAHHVRSRKHDLENHIKIVAKQKHLDAAVMASESYASVERIILLKSCKLFEDASDKALSQVAEIVRMIRVPVGVTLYNEGEPGFDAFIIASGQVRLEKAGRIIGFRGRGDVNGATSLVVAGDPRAATVITAKDTLIMNISKERLDAVMEISPELHRGMIKVLMERLFDTYKRINAIKRVEQRLDYFRQYRGDMRLDVQNMRRLPASGRAAEFVEDDPDYAP
jgi:CRP-like cAMP-binding protein